MTDSNSRLPEPETAAQPTLLIETATLLSLTIAVLSLFLFGWIAENVSRQRTKTFDLAVRARIHEFASPGMTGSMIAVSYLGGDGLIIGVFGSLAVFLSLRWRRAALWLVVSILGALVLDLSLKYAFHRPRPTPFFGPLPHTYSFPSGHALFSFCFYGVLAGLLADRVRSLKLRILVWTLAALLVAAIGVSRIYLGVHYPSDVIAGYLTATLWVSTMIAVDRVKKQRKRSIAFSE